MDIYSSTSPTWLQQQQQQQQAQQQLQSSDAQSAQRPASADWKDSTLVPNRGATPTPVQGAIDLSDFGLGDLSGEPPCTITCRSSFPSLILLHQSRNPPLRPPRPSFPFPIATFPSLGPTMPWDTPPPPGRTSQDRSLYLPTPH